MCKIVRYSLGVMLLVIVGATQVFAQVSITSVPFLQIEPDSRGSGMGNANVAIADNATAIFWNPAGLAFQEGNQVSLTHSKWLPQFNTDLFYDYLVGKYQVKHLGTFAANIVYMNLGTQQYTDQNDQSLGTYRSYDFSAGLAYGYRFNNYFSLGLGVKYIYSNLVPQQMINGIQGKIGTSFGVDLGAMYHTHPFSLIGNKALLSAGMDIANIGPGISYRAGGLKSPIPTTMRIGWALKFNLDKSGVNTLTIANDYSRLMARVDSTGQPYSPLKALFDSWSPYTRWNTQQQNGQPYETLSLADQITIGTGLEYWYNKMFAFRAGYYFESPKNGDRQYLTFGAGLRYNIFGIDFSYIYTLKNNDALANTLRFTVLINI